MQEQLERPWCSIPFSFVAFGFRIRRCTRCDHRGGPLHLLSHHTVETPYLPVPVEDGSRTSKYDTKRPRGGSCEVPAALYPSALIRGANAFKRDLSREFFGVMLRHGNRQSCNSRVTTGIPPVAIFVHYSCHHIRIRALRASCYRHLHGFIPNAGAFLLMANCNCADDRADSGDGHWIKQSDQWNSHECF